jgi:hypothetical protein
MEELVMWFFLCGAAAALGYLTVNIIYNAITKREK